MWWLRLERSGWFVLQVGCPWLGTAGWAFGNKGGLEYTTQSKHFRLECSDDTTHFLDK